MFLNVVAAKSRVEYFESIKYKKKISYVEMNKSFYLRILYADNRHDRIEYSEITNGVHSDCDRIL